MPAELAGLTSAQVAERVAAGQVNVLPSRSGRSTWDIVAANVFTRVNAILFVLLCLVLVTGEITQGAFGLLIIANSVIGVVQELRAKRVLDNLAVVGEAHPVVLRDGQRHSINRDEVVLDDIIVMQPGDQIVVDGSVTDAQWLEVDESLLTGEAEPILKRPGDPVYSGAFVLAGSGTYVAQKVGPDAYAAQLTAQAAKFTLVSSKLRGGIDRILRFVSFLLVPVGALTIWVQFNQPGTTWQESVLRMTAALVPMIPEGLVLLTSMAFALGVVRLGKRQCLVQELPALESLARVTVVCADKTGTLTENAMTLGEIVELDDDASTTHEVLSQLVAAEAAPNASFQAISAQISPAEEPWPISGRAPFSSAKRWSGVSFIEHGHWVLGAPDALVDGDATDRAQRISESGRRVLLLARAARPVHLPGGPGELTPVALLVLDQRVRPDAAPTLEYFRDQGVALKVISGDNAASVGAVTTSLGMRGSDVVDARTLPTDPDEFAEAVENASVFGRVTPEQKRQMVAALQSRGHTVAMTGDGVNDVLAVKDADLGVAMGDGASATRAVAQIVLLDNSFATLPVVVAEGRRVIANVERVAKLFLTKTIYAVALALIVGLMGLPNPFLPLQMTVVGWFTIGIPAFLLSLAPSRERARPGFVGRTLATAIPSGLIVAAVAIVTYVVTRDFGAVSDSLQDQASTATLIALIMTATWVLSVVARPYFAWRVALVAFAYLFYFLVFALPFARRALTLDVSNTSEILFGVIAGLIGMVLVEASWWITAGIRGERPRVWAQARKASEA